jgi:Ricin-type beta-trefoil lectin domain-like/Chaperone of endosialidase
MRSATILSKLRSSTALCRLTPAVVGLLPLLAFGSPAAAQAVAGAAGGGEFLDAKFCGDTLNLNPGSSYDGGACQLWKLNPDSEGWSRLQLKENGKFLDARQCSDDLNMNPGSTFDHGSCQLWKFVPYADGWSRVQIKRNGKFLSATNCTDVTLSEGASDDGADWQLWRFVADADGWSRLQVKCMAGPAPATAGGDDEYVYNGQTYGWYDDGWDGPGWYIVGFEFRRGFGFGGREGWHNWHHHGSHHHDQHHEGGHHEEHHEGGHHEEHHEGGHHEEHHEGGHHEGHGEHHETGHHGGGGGHHGGGGGGGHHGGGGGGGHHHSDIRLKHDIVMLGHLANGLGFYRFSYNGSDKAYVGVMAQEVLAVMPEAVARDRAGYLVVDYDRLGLRMQTWSEWVAAGRKLPVAAPAWHQDAP